MKSTIYQCTNCQRFTADQDYCPHCYFQTKRSFDLAIPVPKKEYHLTCGCCGTYYPSYNRDMEYDQDIGYGHCDRCHTDIIADNERDYEKAFRVIEDSLSPEKLAKWKTKSLDEKKGFVVKLLDEGILTYSISRNQ